jgi:60 kDa SS-A/Ro ribonucleoprotein
VVKVTTWTPNPKITDALDAMWEQSFGAFEPTGRRHLVIVDCSGSMTFSTQVTANGSPVGTAWQVANTMAVILARLEPNVAVINAGTSVHTSQVTRHARLADVAHWHSPGGGTALAVGFEWARNGGLQADGITLLSDMETWAGTSHVSQAWAAYRQTVNPAARALFATLVPTGHTVADPRDESVLNTAGMSADLPQVLAAWLG